jgi:hypothetical protein
MVDEEILVQSPRQDQIRPQVRDAVRSGIPGLMTELLLVGTTVELLEPLYGYPSGARGMVVRIADGGGAVLVRFADTGHAMFVAREVLRIVDRGSAA